MDPFDALEASILAAYPDAELQFAGGVDSRTYPLNGVVFARLTEPVPHWLIVSQGFTDLWDKETDEPDVSGWGFELTCRTPAPTEDLDFGWVLHWMQHIADYLAESSSMIEAGHHMPMAEPRHDADLSSIVFVEDIALQPTMSRHGAFGFLQMVAVNPVELASLQAWHSESFVDLMKERDPLLLADHNRPSFMAEASFAQTVEAGIVRDGSSVGAMVGVEIWWTAEDDELHLHVSEAAFGVIRHAVQHRLSHDNPMLLFGDPARENSVVVLEPGDGTWRAETHDERQFAVIGLSDAGCQELLSLEATSVALAHTANVRLVVAEG